MSETAAAESGAPACCAPLGRRGLSPAAAEATARLFKALADPHRVRLVNHLAAAGAPVCVCDLTPVVGLAQGTVSHHLKRLLEVGLVTRQRRGTWSYYALAPDAAQRLAAVVELEEEAR